MRVFIARIWNSANDRGSQREKKKVDSNAVGLWQHRGQHKLSYFAVER